VTNGSWSGRDPLLRRLRVVTTLVLLGLLAFMFIDPRPEDASVVGLTFGALLVNLGFPFNWPRRE
jgi:hypothetical protein